MRKHRLFGVVIAAVFGTGFLTQQHPSTPHADSLGVQLVSHTTRFQRAPVVPTVRAQSFIPKQTAAALSDTVIALSTEMKPLPPLPPPPPPPKPAPVRTVAPPTPPNGGVWAALRQCESSGNYADDTGNGYFGAYQFSEATWESLGLGGLPSAAPPSVQDQAAQRLEARSGWSQWPVCARRLGLT